MKYIHGVYIGTALYRSPTDLIGAHSDYGAHAEEACRKFRTCDVTNGHLPAAAAIQAWRS